LGYAGTLLGFLPGGSTPGLKELLAAAQSYLPPEQVERIRIAAEFGAEAHKGQKRKTGEPYIAHPVAAGVILAGLRVDADTIVAAILHDVIEDTPVAKEELARRFGETVAEIVDGVTKLDQIQFKSREEAQAESFRKMLLAMVRDLRVILVKLADRLHNMRTIEGMSPVRRRAIARETLEIFAPLAERLGLYAMKLELEDLGFRALYPQRYRVIEKAIKRARGHQKEFLGKISENISIALAKAGIEAEVDTREKHLYSIYKKMLRKRSALGPLTGLAVETTLLAPFAAAFLLWQHLAGAGALGHASATTQALVLSTGVVTAIPLLLFAYGARRIRLTTLGLLQYIAPTVQFSLGVLVFHENFTHERALAFGCIWLGLALYTADNIRAARANAGSTSPR
jgi:hypothetical protein